jgi:hypothetical protein
VVPGVTIIHKAAWLKGEEEQQEEKKKKEHQCHFIDDAYLMFRGNRIPKTRARGDVIFDGPGSVTIFK